MCRISIILFFAIHIVRVDLPKKEGRKKQLDVDTNLLLELECKLNGKKERLKNPKLLTGPHEEPVLSYNLTIHQYLMHLA